MRDDLDDAIAAEQHRNGQKRKCIVCHKRELDATQVQTCNDCVGRVRRSLVDVVDLYAELSFELVGHGAAATPLDHVAGSDGDALPEALVLMIGGGDHAVASRAGNREHAVDEWPSDSPDVIGVLMSWQDDWLTRTSGAKHNTLVEIAGWLSLRLTWAAQHHPAFDEFTDEISDLHRALQRVLRSGPQRSPVPCITCDVKALERPEPREDGRRFEWQCSRCHRNYTVEEYWIAVRQQGEAV